MSDEIVARLRASGDNEAADEIARLLLEVEHRGNEVDRLREAVRVLGNYISTNSEYENTDMTTSVKRLAEVNAAHRSAISAMYANHIAASAIKAAEGAKE